MREKQTLNKIFHRILTGDKADSRIAARQVRKLVYGSSGQHKEIISLIENAPKKYDQITEPFRQENFVISISIMYFLHDREDQPDFLFPWLFQLLQHDNGNIRHAAVRMIEKELGSLTYHIRFPGKQHSFSKLTPEKADRILFGLKTNLNNLSASSWKESYNKCKYIDELPSSTHKSVQLILATLEEYSDDIETVMSAE